MTIQEKDVPSSGLRKALITVVVANGIMALLGFSFGFFGKSQAMQADALDFLGDSVATGISLGVMSRGASLRAKVAWWQGFALGGLGLTVILSALYRTFMETFPEPEIMGVYGIIGLIVNVGCALILLKYKEGDSSVRAAWLYSRNDAMGNIAVLGAALFVEFTQSRWPDFVVACLLAGLFIHSANGIMNRAKIEKQRGEVSKSES